MENASNSDVSNAANGPKMSTKTHTVLRYTISPKEYRALRQLLERRTSRSISAKTPSPDAYDAELEGKDDYNAAAVRASIRLFLASQAGLKLWDAIKAAIARRRNATPPPKATSTALLSPNTRLSLSFSMLLLFHRLLHRFVTRLRANLLTKNSQPFRKRNPRVSKALTARLAPAIGASLAGFALAASPADQLRVTLAIYMLTRSGEFVWNALEAEGWFENRPWWFGSWMLMPGVFGELLYAFVFEQDCFPKPYGDFIWRFSDTYVQRRPADYPPNLPWPDSQEIINGMAEMARLNYPSFESPILHPKTTLPPSLAAIAPITAPAHPAISNLTCALLHPSEPSCTRTYLTFFLQAFPRFAKFFTAVFLVFSLPRYKAFLKSPIEELNALAKRVLRITLFVTGAIGTSWVSICFFQWLFPRTLLPRARFFLGGAMGGFWALLVRKGGRGQFLYSLRSALDSGWKVGKKKGWWKGRKGGDVLLFVVSLMAMNVVYERNPEAINSGVVRKTLATLRGEGWVDVVKRAQKEKVEEKEA